MRKVLTTLFLAAAALSAAAAPRFRTPLLEKMAAKAAIALPDSIGEEADNDSTWTYGGRQLRVRTNALGDVCHIGYKLFHNDIVAYYGNQALCDFLERYFLELDLHLDDKPLAQRMEVDRVVMREGNAALMRKVNEEAPVSINYTPRRSYTVSWTMDGKLLTLSFPTDCQLMLGANAIELEDIVARDVPRHFSDADLGEALAPWAKTHEQRSGSLRQKDYGTYLNRLIGSRIYLRLHNSQWRPDISPSSPSRAVATAMLTGCTPHPLPMRLTVDRYGYKKVQADVTLQQLLAYFRAEGSKAYIGFKTRTDSTVTGTLFVLNEQLGCNHVVPFTFPLSLLSAGEAPEGTAIEAKIYAYIPLQNVTEKFFEHDEYKDPDNYEN